MTAVIERPVSQVLVSRASLRDLSNQMGPDICRQFVGNYIDLWEDRYSRLVNSLDGGDYPGAMDVVLSIKISSQMAGAKRLAGYAGIAQEMVGRTDIHGLQSLLEPMQQCGEDTLASLREMLRGF